MTENSTEESVDETIDYMHPDGKPLCSDRNETGEKPFEDDLSDSKSKRKSDEEADGHHVCSPGCQEHHDVVAKGAQKS